MLTFALLFAFTFCAHAVEKNLDLHLKAQAYRDDHDPSTRDQSLVIEARPKVAYEKNNWAIEFQGVGQWDFNESKRHFSNIEDFYFEYQKQWRLRVGYQIFHWSELETFHPIDTINSRNFDTAFEDPDKLGELSLDAFFEFDFGSFFVAFFPTLHNAHFPTDRSRLNGIEIKAPIYHVSGGESDHKEFVPQAALRYSHTLGPMDFSLSILHHMDRHKPLAVPTYKLVGSTLEVDFLTPHYYRVTQYGAQTVVALGDWLIKSEAAHYHFKGHGAQSTLLGERVRDDYSVVALGAERTIGFDGGSDLILILEGQMALGLGKAKRAEVENFQRDVLLAAKYLFNNPNDSTVEASFIADLERGREYLAQVTYGQRFWESWRGKIQLVYVDAPAKGPVALGLETQDGDHQVAFTLSKFF